MQQTQSPKNPESGMSEPQSNTGTSSPAPVGEDAKSFKIYKGKAPLILQIIGGLMWLIGIGMILQGLPMLLVFGFGIIPIVVGILMIKYAKGIFKMQQKVYKGVIILHAVLLALFVVLLGIRTYSGDIALDIDSIAGVIQIVYGVFVILILKKYKDRFVN